MTITPRMRILATVSEYRFAEAAELLGVSDDTVRRWVDDGRLSARRSGEGPATVDGAQLAAFAEQRADHPDRETTRASAVSARNRLAGIVVGVKRDTVMAQVDMVCGPFRMVSLMSTEAADELGLEPGVRCHASVKSTNVVVETR